MILFRNVSLSRGKSTTRCGVSPLFRRKVTIFIGCETKTHILLTKINEQKIRQCQPSNNNYSFRIINNSTTTTTTHTQRCLKQLDKDQRRHLVHHDSCLFRCAGATLARTDAASKCTGTIDVLQERGKAWYDTRCDQLKWWTERLLLRKLGLERLTTGKRRDA